MGEKLMKTKQHRNERNGLDKTTDHGTTDHGTARRGSAKRAWVRREKEWMRTAVAKVVAEDWWERRSSGQRVLAMRIAMLMEQLAGNKRLEIRREGPGVRARFIHILKAPEAGCLSAIMLPELPAGPNWK
jgi:hypothetical protein